jgi:membrane associated rhomboid family serine protease
MIPLQVLVPRRTTPWMTWALIGANTVVFLHELSLPEMLLQGFVLHYGFVPARLTLALSGMPVPVNQLVWPLFTSMFIHGGWWHLLGNMWFLWVFGHAVEDALGPARFLVLYFLSGIGAAFIQALVSWGSTVPMVGASGAISGVMGAYLMLYPGSQVLVLLPLLFFWFTVSLPALVMIGYWFLVQFLSGLATLAIPDATGVAFWAHVGGFLLGAAVGRRIRRHRWPYSYWG